MLLLKILKIGDKNKREGRRKKVKQRKKKGERYHEHFNVKIKTEFIYHLFIKLYSSSNSQQKKNDSKQLPIQLAFILIFLCFIERYIQFVYLIICSIQ